MKILNENTHYARCTWMTRCTRCDSVFEWDDRDTHLLYNPETSQRETWIQCPVCGRWIKTNWGEVK